MMFFSRERWRTIWLRRVTSRRLRRLVGDPDLRQKAAGVELRQHTSIDLIGFDLGMGNEADLFGVGDNHPTDVRSDHCGNRSRIAGGFDDDNIAVGQLLGKFLQSLAAHDDATQPAELAVFPGHRLGKSAVNIQSNDPHTSTLRSRRLNGSSRATRHLLIRARSASGQVARGGHVTSSGSQPRVCRRPAHTFVLPAPRVPDGLTITRFPEEAADTRGAEIIMPDNGIFDYSTSGFQYGPGLKNGDVVYAVGSGTIWWNGGSTYDGVPEFGPPSGFPNGAKFYVCQLNTSTRTFRLTPTVNDPRGANA